LRLEKLPGERRVAGRVWVGRRATLCPTQPDGASAPPEPVVVRDLAPQGVGLVHTRPMDVGDTFVLALPVHGPGEQPVVRIEARVVRCGPGSEADGDRSFVIGAEVVGVVSPPPTA
jgi:hypothetical protein